jgi:hypothetical protein
MRTQHFISFEYYVAFQVVWSGVVTNGEIFFRLSRSENHYAIE